ncbi:MAG: SpoIIE family protein phosphatase [Planctomycetes bacterium]|nr:SpoIIE family protein phosphatase [Planctomycetota bacterium]
MSDNVDLLGIVQEALGTFDNRQSYSPGMFEPLQPLFRSLGYETVAVYIADDYPDRMQRISGYGGEDWYPTYVATGDEQSLYAELLRSTAGMKGLLTARLYSHGRELGALAATTPEAGKRKTREAFNVLAKSLSTMAYLERVRTNCYRERRERDIFFAQSLTSRLLIREAPVLPQLRLGFEFIRSLEAGGDFFDFMPTGDGGLLGFIGCCNGTGLRTVLEVCHIMRTTHRALHAYHQGGVLSDALRVVNESLVQEKHRAHQASLCVFRVDVKKRKLHLAKAGRLGMLLCGPKTAIQNISAPGASFLGMDPNLTGQDETYDFRPGQALFCVTEGIYSSRNCLNAKVQLHWFWEAVAATLEQRDREALASAIFRNLDNANDYGTRPAESMLALSVEFTGK